jgi:hypothetical protein
MDVLGRKKKDCCSTEEPEQLQSAALLMLNEAPFLDPGNHVKKEEPFLDQGNLAQTCK